MSNDFIQRVILEKYRLEEALDFHFESTFWEEFSIAEAYGPKGIREHYDLVFDQWRDNVKFLTELVLVLSLKINKWFMVDDELGLTYDALWRECDAWTLKNLKGDDLHYYLSTLD